MPTSASGSYSLPTLRFQNLKQGPGTGAGSNLHTLLGDMASGIREARVQGGGGGGGSGSISTGQIASFTACVGDVLATAIRVGTGLSISAGTHDVQINITSLDSTQIASFTACVRDAVAGGFVAGNGITFSTSGHSLEIKTATLTVGQMLSFTANVGLAANAGLAAGTAIVLSFNAATNVTEIRASITSGGGISSFTACVGDAIFPNLKAGTNVGYSFNAATHQTEINVTGSLGAISSLTASVKEIVSVQTTTRYLDDYGAVGDALSHPLSASYASLTAALVDFPYATSLTEEKDYLALLTALYDAPAGPADPNDMVHVQMGAKDYFWGTSTFTPTRPIRLTGWGAMEGQMASRILRNPVGHGIVINDNGAAGSYFEGFRLSMNMTLNGHTAYCAGIIREYNPLTGLAVLADNDAASTLTSSTTFEVRTLLGLGETAYATFIPTGIKHPFGTSAQSVELTVDGNLFTLGETVTWATGSAVVTYTSYRTRALWLTSSTGSNPSTGMTITGGTSGASGVVVERRTNDVSVRAITVLSGTVDADSVGTEPDGYEHFCRQGQFGHGFLLNRRCYLDNLQVRVISGNGIYVAAGGGGYGGNSNLTRIMRCQASDCGGNGIAISGADANVVTVGEGTMTENSGYPIVDNSFLGAIIYGNHASGGAIGGFYFAGGNSIGFGNYVEGNQDKLPLKRKITRIKDSHLDMCGTSGVDRVVRGSGARISATDFNMPWVNYNDATGDTVLDGGGSTDGGVGDASVPCLRVNNGGDRATGIGAAIEMGIPWIEGIDFDETFRLAVPACRMVTQENGGFGRTGYAIKTMRTMGSYVVRARSTGHSFRGLIHTAALGTITSVTTLLTGGASTTFSDTISIVNPGAGVGAVLIPVVRRGLIESVYVQNGGSGYTPSISFATAVSMRDDFLAIHSNVTGLDAQLTTLGVDTNVNLSIAPKGTGIVKVPSTVQMARTCTIVAGSVTASADLTLTPSGAGRVRFGEFTTTATTMLVTGYIEIRDAGGTIRKLAVVG